MSVCGQAVSLRHSGVGADSSAIVRFVVSVSLTD